MTIVELMFNFIQKSDELKQMLITSVSSLLFQI